MTSAQFRRKQSIVKIVATNVSFLHSFRKISQQNDELIQKIMQLPTSKRMMQNNTRFNRTTFESIFTEFTSSLVMDSKEGDQRLDVLIELPGGLESQNAYQYLDMNIKPLKTDFISGFFLMRVNNSSFGGNSGLVSNSIPTEHSRL